MTAVAPNRLTYAVIAILVTANVLLGTTVATSHAGGISVAVVPIVLVVAGALIASNRAVLVYAALVWALATPLPVNNSFTIGGTVVYPSDVFVLLAVVSWGAAWLLGRRDAGARDRRMWISGWPFLLFSLALGAALIHGHIKYGGSILGTGARFALYAAIAVVFTDVKARAVYQWITAIFYVGILWQTGVAVRDLVTGQASTGSVDISTGGERVLAGSTAMLMSGALLLALLNLERDRRAGRTALHVAMAGLATFSLVVTYQRTTFALVALLVPLVLLAFRAASARAIGFLPLAAPFFALAALLVPRADPQLLPTLRDRVIANPSNDTSVSWRVRANDAVWAQVKEAPIAGVGFGRRASFVLDGTRVDVGQDPHDQFLYLWAGGGLLLLGSFVVLLIGYLGGCWRRFRSSTGDERRLVFWVASLWFVFVVNSATGVVLTSPRLLLIFWILMTMPMVVPAGERGSSANA